MANRDPSAPDIIANTLGAVLGLAIARYWNILSPEFTISRRQGLPALLGAFGICGWVWYNSGPINRRGWESPGNLELRWNFEGGGRDERRAQAYSLRGKFRTEHAAIPGLVGTVAVFDGRSSYVDLGHMTALRMAGDMSIASWIKPASFPPDDAAIVSQFENDVGYQFDTTVDKGPRTIGFKLTDACGELMIRYGKTTLTAGRWYHVAGVYDAAARNLMYT